MKKYINELETEKRNYIIKLNKKLADQLQADLYESQMEMQYIDSKNIMTDDALKAIEYHDNYSSFFYTLKDWRRFITGIDAGYLTDEAHDVYNYIMKKLDVLDSMNIYSDNYYNLEEHLEEKTKIILKDIEDFLHTYENYPDLDEAIQYAEEMDQLDNYYIEINEDGTSDNVIKLDVAYTETFI